MWLSQFAVPVDFEVQWAGAVAYGKMFAIPALRMCRPFIAQRLSLLAKPHGSESFLEQLSDGLFPTGTGKNSTVWIHRKKAFAGAAAFVSQLVGYRIEQAHRCRGIPHESDTGCFGCTLYFQYYLFYFAVFYSQVLSYATSCRDDHIQGKSVHSQRLGKLSHLRKGVLVEPAQSSMGMDKDPGAF